MTIMVRNPLMRRCGKPLYPRAATVLKAGATCQTPVVNCAPHEPSGIKEAGK